MTQRHAIQPHQLAPVAAGSAATTFWLAALGLLTTSFMLHTLGASAYGVFALITIMTAYPSNLELGFGHATLQFLARARARGDHKAETRIVETSLFVFGCHRTARVAVTAPGRARRCVIHEVDFLLICARGGLALVFIAAAVGKLLDTEGSRRALRDFNVPESLVVTGVRVLPLAELAVAAGLLAQPLPRRRSPCDYLIPRLARWRSALAERVEVVMVERHAEPRRSRRHRCQALSGVLWNANHQVLDTCMLNASPAALLVDPDRTVALSGLRLRGDRSAPPRRSAAELRVPAAGGCLT